MRESQKGSTGDHRTMSDPINERKDIIDHIKKNKPVDENDKSQKNKSDDMNKKK